MIENGLIEWHIFFAVYDVHINIATKIIAYQTINSKTIKKKSETIDVYVYFNYFVYFMI